MELEEQVELGLGEGNWDIVEGDNYYHNLKEELELVKVDLDMDLVEEVSGEDKLG